MYMYIAFLNNISLLTYINYYKKKKFDTYVIECCKLRLD